MPSKSTSASPWTIQPPVPPKYDLSFYPAYLQGSENESLKAKIEETLDALEIGGRCGELTDTILSVAVDKLSALAKLAAGDGRNTRLPLQSSYQRYLDDHAQYVSTLEAMKKRMHFEAVANREIRKKYKLGVATADTPEMNKGVSFRYTTSEKELLGDPKSHLAWHPRVKPEPAKPKVAALADARKELKAAVINKKIAAVTARTKVVISKSNDVLGETVAKVAAKKLEAKAKADFEQLRQNEAKANAKEVAHLVEAKRLAAAKLRLEKTESKRAKVFANNGKPVTFAWPRAGEFLQRARSTNETTGDGSYSRISFGSIQLSTVHDYDADGNETGRHTTLDRNVQGLGMIRSTVPENMIVV